MEQTVVVEQPSRPVIDVFLTCPNCGSPESRLLFSHKECGNVVRCIQCRLRFTRSRWMRPMPELRQQDPSPVSALLLDKQETQAEDFLDILNTIKPLQPDGCLLELGCFTGHFLTLARGAGYDTTGIEPDPWAAAYARREFGLTVHETPVPALHFDDRSFDVIAMFHVMEHLTEPMKTLRDLHRIIKDTGLLAIEIPIIDTLYPMAMGRFHRHYVFDHILFLSRRLAGEFLTKAGFRIIRTELTGRRIRLERLALGLRKQTDRLGRVVESAFDTLGVRDRVVHINARDNFRIYSRKAL
jgi:SAM-dependent methyltransferase